MDINTGSLLKWIFKKQLIVFIIIFIIVFYAGYRFDISSLKTKRTELQTNEADLKQQMTMVANKKKAVSQAIGKYGELQAMLKQWKMKLILPSALPNLLHQLLESGANNHINFSLFKPLDDVKAGAYLKVPIKVIAVGSYHQIGVFLSQIANMPYIVVISALSLSNENKADVLGAKLAESANASNFLTAEMVLDVYMQPEQKP